MKPSHHLCSYLDATALQFARMFSWKVVKLGFTLYVVPVILTSVTQYNSRTIQLRQEICKDCHTYAKIACSLVGFSMHAWQHTSTPPHSRLAYCLL